MPLIKSKSKAAIGKNIAAEENAGKGRAQSVAIALNVARKAGAKIPRKAKSSEANTNPKRHEGERG